MVYIGVLHVSKLLKEELVLGYNKLLQIISNMMLCKIVMPEE